METRIEAVLFDWGGVLIENPAPGLMEYCAKALGVSVEDYVRVHNVHGEAFQKGPDRRKSLLATGLRRSESPSAATIAFVA